MWHWWNSGKACDCCKHSAWSWEALWRTRQERQGTGPDKGLASPGCTWAAWRPVGSPVLSWESRTWRTSRGLWLSPVRRAEANTCRCSTASVVFLRECCYLFGEWSTRSPFWIAVFRNPKPKQFVATTGSLCPLQFFCRRGGLTAKPHLVPLIVYAGVSLQS